MFTEVINSLRKTSESNALFNLSNKLADIISSLGDECTLRLVDKGGVFILMDCYDNIAVVDKEEGLIVHHSAHFFYKTANVLSLNDEELNEQYKSILGMPLRLRKYEGRSLSKLGISGTLIKIGDVVLLNNNGKVSAPNMKLFKIKYEALPKTESIMAMILSIVHPIIEGFSVAISKDDHLVLTDGETSIEFLSEHRIHLYDTTLEKDMSFEFNKQTLTEDIKLFLSYISK